MLFNLIYFASYELALVLFAVLVWRLLPQGPSRLRHTFLLAFAYLVGMFFTAHVLDFVVVRGSMANPAGAFWDWIAEHGYGDPGALVMHLFRTSSGLWGGPLAVLVLMLGTLVLLRVPLVEKQAMADAGAIALPFSLALCKVGCFAVGCCHGLIGSGPLCITRSWGSINRGLSVFPTQLVDLASYVVVGLILYRLRRRRRAEGQLLLWFVVLFSLFRFASEFTRGDMASTGSGLTPVQLVLAAAVLVTVPMLLRPGLFTGLLGARVAVATPEPAGDGRRAKRYLILLLVCGVLWLPQALFLPIFSALLVVDLIARRSPAEVAYHLAGLAIGLSWLTAMLIRSPIPFGLVFGACLILIPLAFNRIQRVGGPASVAPAGSGS